MDCEFCKKPMDVISEYHNPEVAAGHRLYQCKDHPGILELSKWYCPYIPLKTESNTDVV